MFKIIKKEIEIGGKKYQLKQENSKTQMEQLLLSVAKQLLWLLL